jgi:hypothetical protein
LLAIAGLRFCPEHVGRGADVAEEISTAVVVGSKGNALQYCVESAFMAA